jgi:hypothetical protein
MLFINAKCFVVLLFTSLITVLRITLKTWIPFITYLQSTNLNCIQLLFTFYLGVVFNVYIGIIENKTNLMLLI